MAEQVRAMVCHRCGGEVEPDPDPRRAGWLTCANCGPVYMPLDGRMIRVYAACGLEEAARRVAKLDLALLRPGRV